MSSTNPRTSGRGRATERAVGALFIGAILAYGTGSALTTGALEAGIGSDTNVTFSIGAVLMLLNSVIVASIGILLFPVLRAHSERVAITYLSARLVEAILLAVGIVSLLSVIAITRSSLDTAPGLAALAVSDSAVAYQVAMAALGLGSLFFCALLFRRRLLPRFLAAWGFAGYGIFLSGSVLELLGFAGIGLPLSVPGGLFELALGIWLLVRGFATISVDEPALERAA